MKAGLLFAVLVSTTLLHAECGINKPIRILVQKSYHREKVVVPNSGCKTSEGPCAAAGTIFVVATKKVKYTILLPDGTPGNLEVGEHYSAIISCIKNPMMVI